MATPNLRTVVVSEFAVMKAPLERGILCAVTKAVVLCGWVRMEICAR